MSFLNDFPHVRQYDGDLGWLIRAVQKLSELYDRFDELPEEINHAIIDYLNSEEFSDTINGLLANWILSVKYPPNGMTPAAGDGTTDDTATIQGCIDYAADHGGLAVFFPAGKYLSGPLTVRDTVSLVGSDRYTTVITLKGGSSAPLVSGTVSRITIKDLGLNANPSAQSTVQDVIHVNATGALFDNLVLSGGDTCLYCYATEHVQISNIVFDGILTKGTHIFGPALVEASNLFFKSISPIYGRYYLETESSYGFYISLCFSGDAPISNIHDTGERNTFLSTDEFNAANQVLTPQMYGAVGDGVTDDSSSFIAWAAALNGGEKIGYIPAGEYRAAGVTLSSGTVIMASAEAVVKAASDDNIFIMSETTGVRVNGITFDLDAQEAGPSAHCAFYARDAEDMQITGCTFDHIKNGAIMRYSSITGQQGKGIVIKDCNFLARRSDWSATTNSPWGCIITDVKESRFEGCRCEYLKQFTLEFKDNCSEVSIINCSAYRCNYGFRFGGEHLLRALAIENVMIQGCTSIDCETGQFWLTEARNVTMIGCKAINSGLYNTNGLLASAIHGLQVIGCYFESHAKAAVYFGARTSIYDNVEYFTEAMAAQFSIVPTDTNRGVEAVAGTVGFVEIMYNALTANTRAIVDTPDTVQVIDRRNGAFKQGVLQQMQYGVGEVDPNYAQSVVGSCELWPTEAYKYMRAADGKAIHLVGGLRTGQRVEIGLDVPNNRVAFIIYDGSNYSRWYLDSQGLHQ